MKRQWRVWRQVLAVPDGQHRWDQAYLRLLSWAAPNALAPAAAASGPAPAEV